MISVKGVVINVTWWHEHGHAFFVVLPGIERSPTSNILISYTIPLTVILNYCRKREITRITSTETRPSSHISEARVLAKFQTWQWRHSLVSSQITGITQNRWWISVREDRRWYQLLGGCGRRVSGMAGSHYLSLETWVFVGSVVHCTGGTIRLEQLVVSFDLVTDALFCLLLDILSVFISHTILKFVLSRSLKYNK